MNLKELKIKLEKLNSRNCWGSNEDFNIGDYSGGNLSDAYNGGYLDGEANLAWEILGELDNLQDKE